MLLVDGKPLTVGPYSRDPEAAWGRARRGWAKGYKLHAIYDGGSVPPAWDVLPLNEAEPEAAARLVLSLRGGGGYLLGDKAYDSNPLHDAALTVGCQFASPSANGPRRDWGIAATVRVACVRSGCCGRSSDKRCTPFANKSSETSDGSPTTPQASPRSRIGSAAFTAFDCGFKPN